MVSMNEVSDKLRDLAGKVDNLEQAVAIVRSEIREAKEEILTELRKVGTECGK